MSISKILYLILCGILTVSFSAVWAQQEAQAQNQSEPNYSAPSLSEPLTAVTEPGLLSKAHSALEGIENCTKCHITAKSPGNTKCLDCHQEIKERLEKEIGYHGRFLRDNCVKCHTEHKGLEANLLQFDKLLFNHNLALFPLEGKHRTLDCDDCHLLKSGETGLISTRYIGLPLECYLCHPTPHRGDISINCQLCHTQTAWTGNQLLFMHNRDSKFKLQGAHINVPCEKCHPQKTFKPIPSDCIGCHQDPHQGLMGQQCATCHNEWRWADARHTFNHDEWTSFPLVGAHRLLNCSQCHSDKYKGTPQQCAGCHPDPHKSRFGADCTQCHNQWNWYEIAVQKFNHNQLTAFKLLGKHAELPCVKCHQEGIGSTARGKTCADCHPDTFHLGELGNKCEQCHTESSWKIIPEQFDHKKLTKFDPGRLHKDVACASCHPVSGKFKGQSNNCEACHQQETSYYAGVSIFDDITTMPAAKFSSVKCQDCHSLQDTRPHIDPISLRCTNCHPSAYIDLSHYWKVELSQRADKLKQHIASLITFLKWRAERTTISPSAATITLNSVAEKLDKIQQVITRLQRYGLHNLDLANAEYQRARQVLIDLQKLLERELETSSASSKP